MHEAELGLENPLPNGLLTHWERNLASHWWLVEALVPDHMDLSLGLLEHLPNMAHGYPRASDPRVREQGKGQNVFHDLALEITYCHFCLILVITIWERTSQECEF